jgi:hypothetical protein
MMAREDELVAFIPVDRAVALGRNPKNSWQMPRGRSTGASLKNARAA